MLATVRSILIFASRFHVLMHKYKVTSSILAVVSGRIVMQASSVVWTHVLGPKAEKGKKGGIWGSFPTIKA